LYNINYNILYSEKQSSFYKESNTEIRIKHIYIYINNQNEYFLKPISIPAKL